MVISSPVGILPLFVCILVAIATRRVLVALAVSVWLGATLMQGMNPLLGLSHALSELLIKRSLANAGNMGIILFCVTMGALVGVTTALGGLNALTDHVLARARGRRATQFSAGVLGLILFVDDYASSMVVGNSLGKVVDVRRISREKLAYIADSTAAAASSLIPASTWTAMQLALIASNWPGQNSLLIFVKSIPYQFYSIFCLALVFVIAWWGRDFGPMLAAERRAAQAPSSSPPEAEVEQPPSGSLSGFFVPFGTFLITTPVGLWHTGYRDGASVLQCIANGDPSQALLWAAVAGCMSGLLLGILVQKRQWQDLSRAAQQGMSLMLLPALVLALSFSLKASLAELKLDAWLVESTRAWLNGQLIPVPTFLLAALCAWSTGTSWGTNALLIPLALPLALSAGGENTAIMTVAAVFSGAIFGDHCSPISDTTIVSAAACKTDPFEHFRTQMPYGLLAGCVSVLLGVLPSSLGVSSVVCLAMGFLALIFSVRALGGLPDQEEELLPERQLPVQESES